MIKTSAGWQFDIKEGAEEILTREIGRNELAAIKPCMPMLMRSKAILR